MNVSRIDGSAGSASGLSGVSIPSRGILLLLCYHPFGLGTPTAGQHRGLGKDMRRRHWRTPSLVIRLPWFGEAITMALSDRETPGAPHGDMIV